MIAKVRFERNFVTINMVGAALAKNGFTYLLKMK